MIRVLLVHAGLIPHYRIQIYGYLSKDLKRHGFDLMVTADGIQPSNPFAVEFPCRLKRLSVTTLVRLIREVNAGVIIDYMELKHRYLFPTYLAVKAMPKRKIIYWGQGRDLLDPDAKIKNFAYCLELAMCDSIILYAEHLRKYIPRRFRKKVYVANNTLYLDYSGLPQGKTKEKVLAEYGIKTARNIICIGRMQKRKRLDHLVKAHALMNRPDVGLIFAGPDPEGVLNSMEGDTIYKLGPLYGQAKFDLLSSADLYCLPGAVGLGIVDAFHCGLPIVTEEGDESAEIMYLKDGVNGFIVPSGDFRIMSEKLTLLLDNPRLRERFSEAARKEIRENGSMEIFCSGFRKALRHAVDGLR
jgi:glycosyltransferase involved in cell wall biosynthesis